MATPPRRAPSLRRTASLEMSYPQGRPGPMAVAGCARDLLTTRTEGLPDVRAQDHLQALLAPDRRLLALHTDPPCPESATWLGQPVLAGHRKRLRGWLQQPGHAERPLAVLLDDLVGCAIIADWVWTRWTADPAVLRAIVGDAQQREGVCIAYARGTDAERDDRHLRDLHHVPSLLRPDDPHAFHALPPDVDRTQRRVRRLDLWRGAGGDVHIDAMFQDSGVAPGTQRVAIHEYRLRARAEWRGGELCLAELSTAHGRLPHDLCPLAPAGLAALQGLPLKALDLEVSARLRGAAGCTHLNDAMRGLAAVPALAAALPPA